MLRFKVCGIEVNFWLTEYRALAGLNVVAIDRRRSCEAGERIESFSIVRFAAKTIGRSDAWKLDFTHELSCRVENLDLRVSVFEVVGDEVVIHHRNRLKRFFAFGHKNLPIRSVRLPGVDLDNLAAWRTDICLKPNRFPSLPTKVYDASKSSSSFTTGASFVLQIFVVDASLNVGALKDCDDQIIAVFSN